MYDAPILWGELQILATSGETEESIILHGCRFDTDESKCQQVKKIEFEPIQWFATLDQSNMCTISNKAAQTLMTTLWELGIRPSQGL
jgi:hypothetical protein